jgi:hypothetical protein
MRTRSIFVLACAGVLDTAAFAAAPAAPKAAAGPEDSTAPPEAPGSTVHWEKLDMKARGKYMKTTVLPEMKKVFAAFDPRYSKMKCETCHGANPQEHRFEMPNPALPKLPPPTDRAGFLALQQKKPEIAKFMGAQVKPHMAALLGLVEWNPATPKGFGCYACHTQEAGTTAPANERAPAGSPAKDGAPARESPAAGAPAAAPTTGEGW